MDWEDFRYFRAIAQHGNLSAAARALKVTQSTMGRRLARLEQDLGVRLMNKTPSGHVLTASGERLLAHVLRIEDEALAIDREISGQDVALEGAVRITTTDRLGAQLLTPHLAAFQEQYPGITLELMTDFRHFSLSKREADVALRLVPFEQNEVITKKLGEMAHSLYASSAYLARQGWPDVAKGCSGHNVIAPTEDVNFPEGARWLQNRTANARVVYRSNNEHALFYAARGGVGIALLPCYVADEDLTLERVLRGESIPREIWLGVHRDMKDVPRIRALTDFLTEVLHRDRGRLLGLDRRDTRAGEKKTAVP